MPSTNIDSGVADVVRLADEIRNRNRSHIRALQIEIVTGGVIVRGSATSFYGKQIAFHEVRRGCGQPVLANEIVVQRQQAS
jgi:hypothetical protein